MDSHRRRRIRGSSHRPTAEVLCALLVVSLATTLPASCLASPPQQQVERKNKAAAKNTKAYNDDLTYDSQNDRIYGGDYKVASGGAPSNKNPIKASVGGERKGAHKPGKKQQQQGQGQNRSIPTNGKDGHHRPRHQQEQKKGKPNGDVPILETEHSPLEGKSRTYGSDSSSGAVFLAMDVADPTKVSITMNDLTSRAANAAKKRERNLERPTAGPDPSWSNLSNNIRPPSSTDYADATQSIASISVPTSNPPKWTGPDILLNGRAQSNNNNIAESLFFDAKGPNRILLDLGSVQSISEINTYSWHKNTRANQFHDLYYSTEEVPPPSDSTVPVSDMRGLRWELLSVIKTGNDPWSDNQVAVGLQSPTSPGGGAGMVDARWLLWDVHNPYTFYGEFDVYTVEGGTTPLPPVEVVPQLSHLSATVADGALVSEPFTVGDEPIPDFLSDGTSPNVLSRNYVPHKDDECVPLHDVGFRSLSNEDQAMFQLYFTNPIKCGREHVVVEAGAGDGFSISPSYFFDQALNWKSFNIEADPAMYKSLIKNRPDATNVKAAFCVAPAGHQNSLDFAKGKFHTTSKNDNPTNKVVFSEETVSVSEKPELSVQVPCVSLANIIKSADLDHIDVMYLHVNADEMAVLHDLASWTARVSVWVIELDGTNPENDEAVRETLQENGYVKAKWDLTRWCPPIRQHCMPNEVWLEKGFEEETQKKKGEGSGTERRLQEATGRPRLDDTENGARAPGRTKNLRS